MRCPATNTDGQQSDRRSVSSQTIGCFPAKTSLYLPEAAEPLLPDILGHNLDVVFVGAAPSIAAATTGHYYAGGRNRFWHLLHLAGFTPYLLQAEEDKTVLQYGIGLTAILPGLISTANALLPAPTEAERTALRNRVLSFAPRVVCYNGKDVYRMCTGEPECAWGVQRERLGSSWQYVVHSTSGRADGWGADRLYLFRDLKRLLEAERPFGS